MKASNKSVTFVVETAKNQNPRVIRDSKDPEQELKKKPNEIQIRIEQEKLCMMIHNCVETSLALNYRVLDELNSPDSDDSYNLKTFLNSLEMLGHHWGLLKKEKYAYRVQIHGHLDIYINEIPRTTTECSFFNIKTFVLSCKTPYMKTKNDTKVFIKKEYSNAAGRLHLQFCFLLDLIQKHLKSKIDHIS
jgi:hypothetical protein